jgi:ADP-ribose pyrophosphatase YjhB (NUDIX family)
MVKIIQAERAGKNGRLAVGCSAAVFDKNKEHILLIRRGDNGKWAVPGGYMDAGEDFSEACAREVYEETGLRVEVKRLIGVYTNPHLLLEYPDGNRWQLVVLHFETGIIEGELTPSEESPELQFYALTEIETLEMRMLDRARVTDSFASQETAIIRNEFGL